MSNVQIAPFEAKVKDFGGLLQRMLPQLKAALPMHVRPEKFARVVLTAVRKTPKILECTPESVMGSVVTAAQLGLEPDGVLGEAWLVPYGRECQLIVGYQGFIKLAWQSGMIEDVYAEIVYEGDRFRWSLGTDRKIVHKPSSDPDREKGKITHVYAAAKIKGGGTPFVVMTLAAIERIRAASRAKGGPWETHWESMARKTAVRQLQKWIPKSKEQAMAAAIDELADANLSQNMGSVIDVQAETPAADGAPQGETPTVTPPKEGTRISLKTTGAAPPAPAGAARPADQLPLGRSDVANSTTEVKTAKEGAAVAGKLTSVPAAGKPPVARAGAKPVDDGGGLIDKPPVKTAEREPGDDFEAEEAANRKAAEPSDDDLPPWAAK